MLSKRFGLYNDELTSEQIADEMLKMGLNPYQYIGVSEDEADNEAIINTRVYNRTQVPKLMNEYEGTQFDVEYISKYARYSSKVLQDPVQRARFTCPKTLPNYGDPAEYKKRQEEKAWKAYIGNPVTYAKYNRGK